MRTRDRVVIGWCDPGVVDGGFAADMIALASARSDRIGPHLRVEGSGLLSRVRNELVRTFLDRTDDAWLLMLDSDHRVPVGAFDKVTGAAHDRTAPIVSGLYFAAYNRGGDYPTAVPTIYRAVGDRYEAMDDYPRDTVVRVDAAGTGCLLVHRGVLKAFRDAVDPDLRDWCWFADGPQGGSWVSEDLTFCRRAIGLGFPIHAHTGAVLPHHKRYWLDDRHHRRQG